MSSEVWTSCGSKAARLEVAGVPVRVVLPAVAGTRVRYFYPAWVERMFAGLHAAGFADHAIYSSIERAQHSDTARVAMLGALQAGDGVAARRLATQAPPPVG